MTLAQLESRFFELKGKLAVGQITEDEFKREMEKLRFQDQQGRWWMIGAQSGRWYYYDGSRWLLGQPPSEEPTPPASLPEPESKPKPVFPAASSPITPAPNGQKKPETPSFTTRAVPPPTSPAQTPPTADPAPRPTPLPRQARPVPTPGPVKAKEPSPDQAPTSMPAHLREPTRRGPTLAERVRDEMAHMHTPDVHVPQVHIPEVHAPAPIRRYPANLILIGAVAVGLILVVLMWLAVDNFVPGKPISSILGRAFTNATVTPGARATGTPLGGANIETMLRVGDDLVSKSQFTPALATYQSASTKAPNNADVYVHWARGLALSGRIQDAIGFAQRATRIDPSSVDAQAELTRALAWSGQNDDAIKAGEKAVQLDDKSATAHAFLAEAYLRAGRQADADKEAAAATLADDKSADAHRVQGWVYVLAGKKDQALAEWQQVLDLAPDIFFYHYELGQVYAVYLNDSTSAITEYQKAIDLYPPYVPSYTALGRVYIALNQPGQAILQFQKALTFDGSSNEAFVGLGLAFKSQGRCPQAIPYFQKSLDLIPGGAEATRGLADCGALAKGQPIPTAPAATPGLNAVPTAIVQATVVPLAQATSAPAVTAKGTPAANPATGGGSGTGRIAFSVFDGQYHLYTAKADGSDRKLLTELASEPNFSPDGSQLLYYSWTSDQRGVHRIEANGSADEFISRHTEDVLPSWSVDGTRYVYSTRAGQGSDITKRAYRLRIDDPTARANQDPTDFLVGGQYPTWGPTDQIVYRDCGLPTDVCGLAVINSDGSGKKALTNINSIAPAWSPDGKLVAFTSDYGGNWDVYIISANGGSPSRLTTDPAEDGLPTFSPDGKQIAYASHKGGAWSIWAMGIDGSNQHKLFDLGGELAGNVPGNSAAQPGQVWWEQRISWR